MSQQTAAVIPADRSPDIGGRILVVDDLPGNRLLMSEILRDEHTVETAADGIEALEKVAAFRPDVVLLDLEMPRMRGLEVCRRLRASPETQLLPIVVVTSVTERRERLACLAAGADDFINKPVDVAEVAVRTRSLLRQKRLIDRLESVEAVMVALARTLEAKDPYTHGHSRRVGDYAASLAAACGLPAGDQERVRRAGLLHDIGKIAIRESVLNKCGRPTAEEFAHIATHPAEGERILSGLRFAHPYLAAVRHHHERFDGSGYPDGLRGEAIPMDARIMAVADAFDAMTSDRAYRAGMAPEAAMRILGENAGPQWDPELVRLIPTAVKT